MDFWAQHKDFVLKILAGLGVFLVALIARGVVYGDDLENAVNKNNTDQSSIRRLKLVSVRTITGLEENAKELRANNVKLSEQVGWDAGRSDLDLVLIGRILSYVRRYQGGDPDELESEALRYRELIRAEPNGGFSELRLNVRDELIEEASERNVHLGHGLGFAQVIKLDETELLKYLSQLELVARIARYSIDARVDTIVEVQLDKRERPAVPGGNPEFLKEYEITWRIVGSQEDLNQVLDRLASGSPVPPIRELIIKREQRPRDHVNVLLRATACLINVDPDVPFVEAKQ